MYLKYLLQFFLKKRNSYKGLPSYYKSFDLLSLEKLLGYKIYNPFIYMQAFSHKSFGEFAYNHLRSNERLEFLGDSVLNLVVSESLYLRLPHQEEGTLTKIRANMVKKEALTEVAEKLKLINFLIYDKKLINDSDEGIKTITSDAVEAFIGAIFLDRGFEEAKKFILNYIVLPNLGQSSSFIDTNFKGQLLEFVHSKKLPVPTYRVVKEEGPEHDKRFTIDVYLNEEKFGSGFGKTKKAAEQLAAEEALNQLKNEKKLILS